MVKIVKKQVLAERTTLLELKHPLIAEKGKAGQFVVVKIFDKGERVPLTIADSDPARGTVTIVFQEVGKSTRHLGLLERGDCIAGLAGPLGEPTHAEKFGTVVCVGGGLGIAPIYPIARALKEAGNHVITIIGVRCKDLLFWDRKIRSVSSEFILMSDDGTCGREGLVTVPLKELCEAGGVDRVIAVGPSIMMKFVALTTMPFKVPTVVSLNTLMLDATGMCGVCRVRIGDETRFACIHGPEFDAHLVDWDLLQERQRTYLPEEKEALQGFERALAAGGPDRFREPCKCRAERRRRSK